LEAVMDFQDHLHSLKSLEAAMVSQDNSTEDSEI